MMDQQMSKATTMFMLGVVAGTIATVLSTPRNGKEVRTTIKDTLRRARNKANETADTIEENLKDARDSAQDRLSKTKESTEGLAPVSKLQSKGNKRYETDKNTHFFNTNK